VRRADNLTTFMCRLSRNLGASTSWNPKGLSRPVMGLLDIPTSVWQNGIILDVSRARYNSSGGVETAQ
jgi:hypothetical protein